MFCTKCGAQLNDQDLFCSKCGQKVMKKEEEQHSSWKETIKGIDFERLWKRGVATGRVPVFLAATVVVLLFILAALIGSGQKKEAAASKTEGDSKTQISEEHKKEIHKLLEEGSRLLAEGNMKEAGVRYEQAKAVNADYEEVYLFGADVQLKQNNYNMALQILKEGQRAAGSDRLAAREAYIKENVFLVGVKSEDGEKNFYHQYSAVGNLFREHKYDEEYQLTGWEEIEYDEAGRKKKSILYNARGEQQSHYEYEYDEWGQLLYRTDYDLNKAITATHRYSYDEAGRQVSCEDYDSQGVLTWSTRTEYDDQGRKVKDMGYDKNGKLTSWVETTYNADGSVAKMARYDEQNQLVEWNESQYDKDGNESRSTTYDQNNTALYWTETEYAQEGIKTVKTRYHADGSIYSRAEYDFSGKKVKETIASQQMTYQYAYFYFGDILCENEIQPIYGEIKIMKPLKYRNLPNKQASYAGTLYTDKTYRIIGQTDQFYQLAEGGYLEKEFAGTAYATAE